MQLNKDEINFLKSLKSRQCIFNKTCERNSLQRKIAEGLKVKGLVQIEDISIDKEYEFAQLTRLGKKKIEDIEQ